MAILAGWVNFFTDWPVHEEGRRCRRRCHVCRPAQPGPAGPNYPSRPPQKVMKGFMSAEDWWQELVSLSQFPIPLKFRFRYFLFEKLKNSCFIWQLQWPRMSGPAVQSIEEIMCARLSPGFNNLCWLLKSSKIFSHFGGFLRTGTSASRRLGSNLQPFIWKGS